MPTVFLDTSGNSILISRVPDLLNGYFNIKIEKYNKDGVFQWEYEINRGTSTWSRGLKFDSNGNIVLLSTSNPSTAPYYSIMHLAKFNPSGVLLWEKPLTNQMTLVDGISNTPNFDIDANDNIYLGCFGQVAIPGNCWSETKGFTARGYFCKYNSFGLLDWEYLYDDLPSTYSGGGTFSTDTISGTTYGKMQKAEDNCWSSNINGNCTWYNACQTNYAYNLIGINSSGTKTFDTPILAHSYINHISNQGNYYIVTNNWSNTNNLEVKSATNTLLHTWTITGIPYNIVSTDDESKIIVYSGIPDLTGNDLPAIPVLTCYNNSGTTLWEIRGDRANLYSTIITLREQKYVYYQRFVLPNSYLVKIDIETGSEIWKSPIQNNGFFFFDNEENIYVKSNQSLIKYMQGGILTIKDVQENVLSNTEFYLIRAADDAPLFTPDTLGIVKTDADGIIQLTPVQ